MGNGLTERLRHAPIFVQGIMITCQQSKVSDVLSRDLTLIAYPMISNLQIFQKQSLDLGRFVGGYFQNFLDAKGATE